MQFELDGGYATEMSWQGRLSGLYWQERPGAHNSRGRTAQPPLRGETGPDNAARPVLQGRGGRGRALPHGQDFTEVCIMVFCFNNIRVDN